MKTAIIAAVPGELALLLEGVNARKESSLGLREIYIGEAGGNEVVVCISGMGKINAASAATSLIERFAPSLVVSTGCCGAYRGAGLRVGDLAMATTETCGDEGVSTSDGWQPYDFIGLPAVRRNGTPYFNEFPLSAAAAERASHLASLLGLRVRRGKFVTVSTCSGTAVAGDRIAARFGAICESMEGAAVAQVALQYGVDSLEIRGISNIVEDRDLSRWDIPLAVEQAERFLLKFLQLPDKP